MNSNYYILARKEKQDFILHLHKTGRIIMDKYLPLEGMLIMLVYEDYHFGEPQEMALYHIENFSHFAHLHRSYELLYVAKGNLTAFVDNRCFHMRSGDFILILPYEIHSYENENYAECYINVFSPDYIREFYKLTAKQALEKPVFRLEEPVFIPMKQYLFLDNTKPLYSKSYLYYIAARLFEESGLMTQTARRSDLLHQILTYIQEHYLEPLTLQNLASFLGYNRLYLSRYINSTLNLSFTDLLNQHRINYATYLLGSTSESISDIAFACGYSNLRTFNRCFQEFEHCTPREYRKLRQH